MVARGGRTLGDGEVSHELVMGGSVPVLLAVRRPMDVAWADLDDVLAPGLHEADTVDHVEGLAPVVRVPGRARTWREVQPSRH